MRLRKICLPLASAITGIIATHNAFAGVGGVDTTFNVSVNNTVYSAFVQPSGKILIGGAFNLVNGVVRNGYARLNPDGTLDASFTNQLNGGGTIYAILQQPDGRILIGGSFSAISVSRQNVARLNQDGSIDGTFTNSAPNNTVFALGLQTDGRVLIGGQFNFVANSNRTYIARLNIDGTYDPSFNPGNISGGTVNAIAVQDDGNILIGGSFSSFSTYGLTRNNMARLLTNGLPDLSYQPTASSTIQAIYLQDDGRTIWAGQFTTLANSSRGRIGRLNTDGSIDGGFNSATGANNTVYAVTEDTDGNVYLGGQFSGYNNLQREGVARVFPDSTLDTFNSTTNFPTPTIRCLAIQNDGRVLAGGSFVTFNLVGRTNLVRLYGDDYPPEFTVQPQGRNVAVGTNITFSVDVSNPTPVAYQWRMNGEDIPYATDSQYSLFNVQLGDAGTYSCFASSAVGGTTSSNAVLQVGIAPAITQQPTPTNQTVSQGQIAMFSAAASGTPLNYYWFLGGKTLVGTNTTLVLTNVQPAQAGNYTFVASNFLGTATSAPAALSVLFPVTSVSAPASQTVAVGGTANFSVTATGNPLNYQWLFNSSPIPGATSSHYSLANVALTNAGGYSVIVSNQFNSLTSSVATLTVGFAPSFTQQPLTVTNNLGDTVTFTSAVSGSGTISEQWFFNGNPVTNAISTNLSLTLTNVQIANIGNYSVTASSVFGSTTSSNAFLNLNGYPSNLYAGLLAWYPFSGNANDATGNGNNGTVFSATLTTDRFGVTNMAYAFDGVSSFINASIPNLPSGSSPRTVSLWGQASPLATNTANLAWWGFSFPQQGFGIAANGSPFTWQGQSFGSGNDIDSGVVVDTNWHQIVAEYTGSDLIIAVDGIERGDLSEGISTGFSTLFIGSSAAASFFPGSIDEVRVYDHALSTNDIAALYALESGQINITQQPQPLMVHAGGTASFSVQASGAGTLGYQWYCSNSPIANATNSSLTITNVGSSNAGPYYVVVSNLMASIPSAMVNLVIGTSPQMLSASRGANNSLAIQMPGTPGFNYYLQTTTNLTPPVTWQTIATNPAGTNGIWTYVATNLNSSASFYRVWSP